MSRARPVSIGWWTAVEPVVEVGRDQREQVREPRVDAAAPRMCGQCRCAVSVDPGARRPPRT